MNCGSDKTPSFVYRAVLAMNADKDFGQPVLITNNSLPSKMRKKQNSDTDDQ